MGDVRFAQDTAGKWHSFELVPHTGHPSFLKHDVPVCGAKVKLMTGVSASLDVKPEELDLCSKCKKAIKS
jgi:hypothetical protein